MVERLDSTLKPYPFQRADLDKLAKHNWTAPIFAGIGSGKTAVATWAGVESGADVKLVIAPQATHRGGGWEKHVNLIDPNARFQILSNGNKAGRSAFADAQWGVSGWYVMTPQLFTRMKGDLGFNPDMVIVDEVHQLASNDSAGSGYLRDFSAGSRIAMSGTPVRNKIANMWTINRFLWPEKDGRGDISDVSMYRWLAEWLNEETDTYWTKQQARDERGHKVWLSPGVPKMVAVQKTRKSYTEEKNPGALIAAMPVCIIHKRREYCCDFHPDGFLPLEEPMVSEVTVELTAGQKRAIREIEREYVTWLGDNPLVANLSITQRQRIRQMTLGMPHISADGTVEFDVNCDSPKLDEALSILEEVDYEPTILFTSSQRFAAVATERLNRAGIPAAEYSGATVKVRDESVEGLRAGRIKALVVVIAAGGTGLNLQFVSNEIWFDRDVDPVNNEQAEGRTDRLGAVRRVQRFILHDDLGYDQDRYSAELEKQLRLNQSFALTPSG